MTDYHNISEINFGILSPEEILKMSVCEINSSKLTGPNSIYDERLGVIGNNKLCVTCGKNNVNCVGHFGHINLNIPIIHSLCIKEILYFLKCFCFKCSKIIIDKNLWKILETELKSQKIRLNSIVEKSVKNGYCKHCRTIQPLFSYNPTDNIIYMIYKNREEIIKTQLFVNDIRRIFENISEWSYSKLFITSTLGL